MSCLKERHPEVGLHTICRLLGYSRQAYYKQLKSNAKRRLEEVVLLEMIKSYRKQMPRLGGAKLHYLINQSGYRVGRKELYELLRNNKLLVRRRKKYAVTTNSKHWMRKYPNLICGFDVIRPNVLWVSDITYISINNDFAYLSLITDAYSHAIVGYELNRTLESNGCVKALQMAINATPENHRIGLIHHSDRGCQYCSREYVKLLNENYIRISMTENGDPYENALAERINGILKSEWIDHEKYTSLEQAKERIGYIINTYNTMRPHLSCNMMTPDQAKTQSGKLKKRWKKREYSQKQISLQQQM